MTTTEKSQSGKIPEDVYQQTRCSYNNLLTHNENIPY